MKRNSFRIKAITYWTSEEDKKIKLQHSSPYPQNRNPDPPHCPRWTLLPLPLAPLLQSAPPVPPVSPAPHIDIWRSSWIEGYKKYRGSIRSRGNNYINSIRGMVEEGGEGLGSGRRGGFDMMGFQWWLFFYFLYHLMIFWGRK